MLKEFRDFISKGNLVEIAVAFIMGLAFAAVVTAFTAMVLGAIAYVFGSTEGFDDLGVHKDGHRSGNNLRRFQRWNGLRMRDMVGPEPGA